MTIEPDEFYNGVHVSASPLEALAERCNWLGANYFEDPFGKQLLDAGILPFWINKGLYNPLVRSTPTGTEDRMFSLVEDMDSEDCIAKLKELYELNAPPKVANAAVII